ncbi:NC domain-containing protein [Aphelenchoides besseyi]|nr:NC domain-containing protein [Aphelenchoides besseyi]
MGSATSIAVSTANHVARRRLTRTNSAPVGGVSKKPKTSHFHKHHSLRRNRALIQQMMLRTGWIKPSELLAHLEVGDLIEFDRSHTNVPYYHWAVYLGFEDGERVVIHFSTEHGDFGDLGTKAEVRNKLYRGSSAHVRVDPFTAVAGVSTRARINNQLDLKYSPYPPVIIKDRCLKKLGSTGYNLIFNNCEQFAKWARYGRGESDQAMKATSAIATVGTLVCTGSVSMAFGAGALILSSVYVGRRILHRLVPYPPII